ncbi:ferredoxin [Streptomyces sp. NPDC127119]|uniref:ferredoxin n=1 Tax=Streptomyces sp. NPDC127119 TaxID=3345370 RepID=UPI00362BC194
MDRSCAEERLVDCIYEGERKLDINPMEGIDCGAREVACPDEAGLLGDAVPDLGPLRPVGADEPAHLAVGDDLHAQCPDLLDGRRVGAEAGGSGRCGARG